MKKLFFTIIAAIGVFTSFAAIRTAVSGNWRTTGATNTAWGGTVTTTADTCIIPNLVTVIVLDGGVTCGAFIIEAGGVLTMTSSAGKNVIVPSGGGHNGTVTINGTVNMANSGTQFISWNGPSFTLGAASSWTWAGSNSSNDGGIRYTGTTSTTLFGNSKLTGTLWVTAAGGTVNIASNVDLRHQGTNNGSIQLMTSTSNVVVATGVTVTLSSVAAAGRDFVITSGGKVTLNGTAVIDNKAGTTGTIAGAGAITLNGTSKYIHNHAGLTLIGTGGITVVYNAGTTCEVKGAVGSGTFGGLTSQSFQNFIWNTSQTGNVNFNGVDVTVAGTFDVQNTGNVAARALRFTGNTAGSDINITGDFKVSGLNGITTVDMVNGTGTCIVTVNGNVSIGGNSFSSTLTSIGAGGSTLRLKGNWTNGTNGVFTPANTTVEFNSATANQSITRSGGETFNTLIINNTFGGTGVTLANNATAATLTLTAGKLATGANTMTVSTPSGGLSTGGSTNYVNGNLVRTVATAGSTISFPMGDATNYTPASLLFSGSNTAVGTIQGSVGIPGVPPPGASGLSATKYVDRSWTLTASVSGTPDYQATFTYIDPTDVVGGANTSALVVSKDNTTLTGTSSSVSPTVVTTTGQNAFSTFQVGEVGAVAPTLTVTNSPQAYTGSPIAATVGSNSAGAISDIKYDGSSTVPTNVGTYAITADQAADGGFTAVDDASAGNFSIVLSEASANFRSVSPGGNLSSAGTWEYYDGISYVPATVKPGTGNNVEVRHNVLFNEDFTIGAGKTLSVSAGTADFNGQAITVQSTSDGSGGTGAIGRTIGGTITNATNVTVERFIPSSRQAWRQLSAPTTGTRTIRQSWMEGDDNGTPGANNVAGKGTIISTGYAALVGNSSQVPGGFDAQSQTTSLKYYDSAANAFKYFNNVNHPVAADSVRVFGNSLYNGGGYFLFIRGNRTKGVGSSGTTSTTLRSKGGIKTGVSVTTTLGASQTFRLIANPFASEINFTRIDRTGNVANSLYLWDALKGTTGGYETFNGPLFEAVVGGGSWAPDEVDTLIQSGQAFFVSSTGGGTVTIDEDSKAYANSGVNSKGLRPAASSISKFSTRLLVGDKIYDGNAVVFNKDYSNSIDADDALKLTNPGEDFAIASEGKELAVESRQLSSETVISFTMKNMKQQAYSLQFTAANMGTGEAYLVDNYLGTQTAISLGAVTKVNFTVTADAKSAGAGRFKVVFRPTAVTAVEGKPVIKVSPNPVESGIMNVTFTNQARGRYNLKLVDLSGRLLFSTNREHAGGSANQQVTLPSGLSAGTYQLVITSAGKAKQVQKVLINANK